MTRNTLMFLMLALLLGGAAFADERRAADTIDATTIHRAVADPSLYLEPALTVANPSLDRGIEIRIVVWSSSVETRRVHQVQLEAGGTLQVSLDSVARFDRLAVQSADRFDARLESLVDGDAEQLIQVRVHIPWHGKRKRLATWGPPSKTSCSAAPSTRLSRRASKRSALWTARRSKRATLSRLT
ncbi:MAG: hypothetical protein AAGD38_08915, partial [Acidobacteriota bacterium]